MEGSERRLLLELARRSIEGRFSKRSINFSNVSHLNQRHGCFVTLRKGDALVGSMGFAEAEQPLYEAVHEAAVQAAFDDPRFDGIDEAELAQITIEITLLEDPKELEGASFSELASQITPTQDAVLIKKGFHWGLRLAHPKNGETPEEFLSSACERAGIDCDSITDEDCHVYAAAAEVFSEHD